MTLSRFYDLLEQHDWYYIMSDSIQVEERGRKDYEIIKQAAKESNEHMDFLAAYTKYMWTGVPFNSVRFPKPNRPKGE